MMNGTAPQHAGLRALIADVQSSLQVLGAESPAHDPGIASQAGYQRLIHRLRGMVRGVLPADATVAVVSRGDDSLLRLDGRTGWHFPQTADGTYAGHHPSSSTEAIEHLEELRRRGAGFLVFPSTALWWLDHYAAFREHLDERYPVVVREQHTCQIYSLENRDE